MVYTRETRVSLPLKIITYYLLLITYYFLAAIPVMSTSSETEIREIKDLLVNKLNELDKKIDNRFNELDKKIDIQFNELDKKVIRVEEKLNGIDTRLNNLESRVNSQTNWFLGIFGILVAGLLTIVGKLGFFPNA